MRSFRLISQSVIPAFILVVLSAGPAEAQGFSNLLNRDLPFLGMDTGSDLFCDVVTGGQKLTGKVTRAQVTTDTERETAIVFSLSGWQAAKVTYEVIGTNNRMLAEVPKVESTLEAGATSQTVRLLLRDGLPEGKNFESMILRISFARPGKACADQTFKYQLARRWQTTIRPDNVVVMVTPRAVGHTIALPADAASRYAKSGTDMGTAPAPPVSGSTSPVSHAGHIGHMAERPVPSTPATETRVLVRPAIVAVDTTRFKRHVDPSRAAMIIQRRLVVAPTPDQPPVENAGGIVASSPIDLLQNIQLEPGYPVDRLRRLLGFGSIVYRDRSRSDLFYFLPNEYHLMWNAEMDVPQRFSLAVQYRTAADATAEPKVNMAIELSPGLDIDDQDLASRLARAYLMRSGHAMPAAQVTFPGWKENPRLSLERDLGVHYDVRPDQITVSPSSDIAAGVTAEWVTSEATANDMQLRIVQSGLAGNVTLTPDGDLPPQALPFQIAVRDVNTYGPIHFSLGRMWRNTLSYPVRVQRLNALVVDRTNGTPAVLTWDLGDSVLPPLSQLQVDASNLPGWVEQQALRIWVDYDLVASCRDCDDRALADLRIGAGNPSRQNIVFESINPLRDLDLYRLRVKVRSHFLDPRAGDLAEGATVEIPTDRASVPAGVIYPPTSTLADSTLFEYRLTAVKGDGTTLEGSIWIPVREARVLIGAAQVKQSIPELIAAAAPGTPQ
ncbi:MAG: hypothetical protein ABI679_04345 [Gemmatimonadota bacterium]